MPGMHMMEAPAIVMVNGVRLAAVDPLDRGLHFGDGVFETMVCVDRQVRLLDTHLQRLSAGLQRLGIDTCVDAVSLRQELLVVASELGDCMVKLMITRGVAKRRGYGTTGNEIATRIVLGYPMRAADLSFDPQPRAGVAVQSSAICLGENPALAGIKHLNRLEQVLARRLLSDGSIHEVLQFTFAGRLVCGASSNLFVVQDACLLTPMIDTAGVAGVMRSAVLAAARRLGIPSATAILDRSSLQQTAEAFLTNARIGLQSISHIDARQLARSGAAADTTLRLTQSLHDLLRDRTPVTWQRQ